ncbi:MAG: hypothetical protein HND51_02390 [Chloroflexi bacterium]|nr:hypothetical protein [Chloroflexota bacterium]
MIARLMGNDRRSLFLKIYLTLAAFEGLIALAAILLQPTDPKNAWLLGYSRTRLLLAAAVLIGLAILAILSFKAWRDAAWTEKQTQRLINFVQASWLYLGMLLLAGVAVLVGGYGFLFSRVFTDALIQARLERLAPILLWIAFIALQSLLFLPLLRYKESKVTLERTIWFPALIASAVFILLAVLMSATRLGLSPDRTGWDDPGVPLLPLQVLLAVLLSLLLYSLLRWLSGRFGRIDIFIFTALWLGATLLWWNTPLTPTYFSPTPRAPNFEYYPYSDAATQDLIAQNLLIGEGYVLPAEKPLYSLFLVLAHTLVGQDYLAVTNLQVALLALFPAIIYLLGKRLGNPLAGLIAALLVILREHNAIALSGEIGVSHSKLLMTDMPAALAIAAFTLFAIVVLRKQEGWRFYALALGGAVGLMSLLRVQTLLIAAVVGLLLVIQLWSVRRLWWQPILFMTAGYLLAAMPWFVHNGLTGGGFWYQQGFQANYLSQQYSLTPELLDPQARDEGFGAVMVFTQEHPGEVGRFITAHFLHNEVSSLLALPSQFSLAENANSFYNLRPLWEGKEAELWEDCCSLLPYVEGDPFWSAWNGVFPTAAVWSLLLNLALIALGIGLAWKRLGWVGLVPLVIHLAYSFSTAIARVSGWRLILPVDWVLLLYYALGMSCLILIVSAFLSGKRVEWESVEQISNESHWNDSPRAIYVLGAAVFVLALSMPLLGVVIPQKYAPPSKAQVTDTLTAFHIEAQDLQILLDDPALVVLQGRTLWPRLYGPDQGESGKGWPEYTPRSFRRLGFRLAGPQDASVIMPLGQNLAQVPHAEEVIVLGCQQEDFVEARFVILPYQQKLLTNELAMDMACDTQE